MRIPQPVSAVTAGALVVTTALIAGVSLRDVRASERSGGAGPGVAASATTTAPAAAPAARRTGSPIVPSRAPSPSPQPSQPPRPAPCLVPPAPVESRPPVPGVTAVGPPAGLNERLSPDGRYLSSETGGLFLSAVGNPPTYRSCLAGRAAMVEGWLADGSGVVVTASRPTGGRGVFVLGLDGTLTDARLDAPPAMRDGVHLTADGRWIALLQGDTLTIAALDGDRRFSAGTVPWPAGGPIGWIDDRHLLIARPAAPGRYRYSTVDVDGAMAPLSQLDGSGLSYGVLGTPDGRGALVFSAGPSTAISSAWAWYAGSLRPIDVEMMFGWSGPHELVARRGEALVSVDLATAAVRVVAAGLDPQAATFPLFASARGPIPYGAGVRGPIVCWHNSGPALHVADLRTGRMATVVGPGTVEGVTADGQCLTTEGGGHGLVDAAALVGR